MMPTTSRFARIPVGMPRPPVGRRPPNGADRTPDQWSPALTGTRLPAATVRESQSPTKSGSPSGLVYARLTPVSARNAWICPAVARRIQRLAVSQPGRGCQTLAPPRYGFQGARIPAFPRKNRTETVQNRTQTVHSRTNSVHPGARSNTRTRTPQGHLAQAWRGCRAPPAPGGGDISAHFFFAARRKTRFRWFESGRPHAGIAVRGWRKSRRNPTVSGQKSSICRRKNPE